MDDTTTIDGVITALYDNISCGPNEQRDWNRERNLFYPGARLVRTSLNDTGTPRAESMNIDTYIINVEQLLKDQGFFEQELSRETFEFGNFAHVLSSYEARRNKSDPQPFKRGVNSIQLYFDHQRWWIMHMIWDNERTGLTLPKQLLSI